MKQMKLFALAALATTALAAFAAGTASATTLEVNGVSQTGSVSISASNEPESGVTWLGTNLVVYNTCFATTAQGATSSPFTGTTVGGPLSSLTFSSCTREKVVVDKAGSFSIERIGSTTNGTLRSIGTEVTVPSPLGTLNCKTGAGVDIGTLTGKASGHATIDVNAVLNCGFLAPSAIWGGTYTVTSPTGLGITA